MTEERTFDRRVQFDPRSRNFPVRTLLGVSRPPRSYTWSVGTQLDQGAEGACVGFGWAHELNARPSVVVEVDDALARTIYRSAQTVDEWEGEAYEGTSVLAGAKVVQRSGWIREYRWAFGLPDVLDTLGYLGPVVLGVNWYTGMFDPDSSGRLHVTGSIAGGHCILARGVSHRRQEVLLRNSWGTDWGFYGDATISFADLERLLHEQGEACVPVGRDRIGSL